MKISDVDVRIPQQFRTDAPEAAGSAQRVQSAPPPEIRADPREVDLDGVPTPLSGVDQPLPASGPQTIDIVV